MALVARELQAGDQFAHLVDQYPLLVFGRLEPLQVRMFGTLEREPGQRGPCTDAEPTAGNPRGSGSLADARRAGQQHGMRHPAALDALQPCLREISVPGNIH